MVESIYGQGFAYMREVEEERLRKLVKLGQKTTRKRDRRLNNFFSKNHLVSHRRGPPFIAGLP
jgi:hypothetical protein